MTKAINLFGVVLAIGALVAVPLMARQAKSTTGGTVSSFYDLTTMTLDGKPGNLAQYKGKVSLVVNVASKCGYTPQYEGLEKLQRQMKDKGFNVLGFPSNDFGGQEPGTAQEIATFCKLTYDVTFPMFEKVVTRKGTDQSPVYTFLGELGEPSGVELQQVRGGQAGQDCCFLRQQGDTRGPGAASGHRQGTGVELTHL